MKQMKFEYVDNEGETPFSTAVVCAAADGRHVPKSEVEAKLAAFLRGIGYPVVRVAIHEPEAKDEE